MSDWTCTPTTRGLGEFIIEQLNDVFSRSAEDALTVDYIKSITDSDYYGDCILNVTMASGQTFRLTIQREQVQP